MKRYKLSASIASLLLGVALLVPICISVHMDKAVKEVPETKPVTITAEPITPEPIEPEPVEEVVVFSPEPIEEETIEKEYLGSFTATAYCPCSECCGKWADGLTYTETVATEGRTIAVDPDVIPLGSIVEINGVEYVAEDIGGAIKDNHVDIFFNSHQDALEWGVQYHDVYIVEEAID